MTYFSGCTGGNNCCTRRNKCGEGEGDCDGDKQCKKHLECGNNNCLDLPGDRTSFDKTDDCCVPKGIKVFVLFSYHASLYMHSIDINR